MATINLSFMIPRLRLHLGDTDASAYRYLDEWLRLSLAASIETLQPWWDFKYLINEGDDVYRNPSELFYQGEPPVIQRADIRPIILMASIILKSGQLENFSWNLGSWRDAEISFSNIEASRRKGDLLEQDWNELKSILKPPQKRLASSNKSHLPGYLDNPQEYD